MKRLVTSHRKVRRLDSDPLKQDLLSSGHTVSYIRHLVRGNEIKVRRFGEQSPDRHPPVLLIHGFMGTRGSMFVLEQRLIRDGFNVISFNLGPLNVRDIRSSALLIHRKVQTILSQTSQKKIDIVGHSMGGLIGQQMAIDAPDRVRSLACICSFSRGKEAALLTLPVVIVAKTDYGDVRMEITDYAAGTGARLADGALSGN